MSIQTSWRGASLRDLLGCGGSRIDWRLPAVFVVAQFLSNLPEALRTLQAWESMPAEFRTWFGAVYLLGPVLLGAAAVLAHRLLWNVWLAAVAAASAYALFMLPVRVAFSPRFQAVSVLYSWLWVFLLFAGLALAMRLISILPLALAAGATAAAWLNIVIIMTVSALTSPDARWSLSGQLGTAGLELISAVIFALVLWGGVEISGVRLEAPGAPVAAPSEAGERDAWLRKALAFHGLSRQLRASGIGSLLFGVLAILLGAMTMGQVAVNGVLVLLGIVLIGEGIWIMAAPSAAGIMVDGLAVAAIGIWNIGISLADIGRSSGGPMTGRFLVFGLFQIVWGIGRAVQYGRYADLRGFRLDSAGRGRLEAEIAAIRSDAPRPDVIAFRTGGLKSAEWRLRLLDGHAALFQSGKVVEVLSRREVGCDPAAPKAGADHLKIALRLRKRKLSVTISHEAWERLRSWTAAPAADALTAARF